MSYLDRCDRSIRLDRDWLDVIPERTLMVLGVGFDRHAIRIAYLVTPRLPTLPPWGSPSWQRPAWWYWEATDDLGNRYDMAGGASSTDQAKETTDGVLSLTPLPNAAAKHLRILVNPWYESQTTHPTCVFTVDLQGFR